MQSKFQRIGICLWFEDQAEEAAAYYTSIFDNSRIVSTLHYGKESAATAGRPEGSVMTVHFELDGHPFEAVNGGPVFKFNEAVSIVVHCESQAEVDYYWNRLSQGGDEKAQQCGWLKDKYGVSWQIASVELLEMIRDPDPEKVRRVVAALLTMKKLDVEALRQAAD